MSAPRRYLPSISALQALEAVERLGSATAAAQELSLTQSAVSRQIQALEARLGTALVNRAQKRLVLTRAGAAYAAEIRAALEQIAQASFNLASNPGGGTVNLAILPTFGMHWLVPRLPGFAQAHRDITINMTTRIERFNFAAQPFDAAISFGDDPWPEAARLKLAQERVLPVMHPDLARGPLPLSAGDLAALPLLHIRSRPDAWRRWFAAQGVETGPLPGMFHDQFSTMMQAALHGLGVALLPEYLVAPEITQGRLIAAVDGPGQSLGNYWLIWPESRAGKPALRAFRQWLEDVVSGEDMLPR